MPESYCTASAKRDLLQILKTPRLLPTTAAHCLVESPYFLFPALLLLIQAQFNLNNWQVGLLGAGPMLLSGVMAPFVGALGDRIQKTSVIAIALGLTALGSALIGFFGDFLVILILGLALLGLTSAIYHPAGFGVISQDSKRFRKQSRMFAIHGVGGSLGAGLGPLSVGFLLEKINYSWKMMYVLWACPLFAYALLYKVLTRSPTHFHTIEERLSDNNESHRYPKPIEPVTQKGRMRVITRGLLIIISLMALVALGQGSISFFLPAYLSEVKMIPIARAALIYSIAPIFGIVGQLIGGAASDKISEKNIVQVVMLGQASVLLLIYMTNMIVVLLMAFCLLGIVTAAVWPATASLTASSSTEENRGAAYGLYMVPSNILGAIAPVIGGLLIGLHYSWLFGFSVILILIGVLIMHLFSEKTAKYPILK